MKMWFTDTSSNLIKRLTDPDPAKRLGCGKNGYKEIKKHKFFDDIDWEALSKFRVKSPYQPKLKAEDDVTQFDKLFTEEPLETGH